MILRSMLFAAATVVTGAASAASPLSCSAGRDICERVCTPERAAFYYAGSERRCTASCEPRWQACLTTGFWVPLEHDRSLPADAYRP